MDSFDTLLKETQEKADQPKVDDPNIDPNRSNPTPDSVIVEGDNKTPIPDPNKPTESKFDLKSFNEMIKVKFGKEFKEEKEIEDLFSLPTKVTEYQTKETEYNETKTKFEALQKQYDSEKENFKLVDINKYIAPSLQTINQMLIKYPDYDAAVMIEIGKMDLSKKEYSDKENIDALVKKEFLKDADIYKGLNEAEVNEVILSKLGITETDPESWDKVTKVKVGLAGKQARMEFAELKKVEPNTPVNVEKLQQEWIAKRDQQITETKNQWTPRVNKMFENLKKEPLPILDSKGNELIKWNVELNGNAEEEAAKQIEFLAYTGQPVNEETVLNVLADIKGRQILKDSPKIFEAVYQKGKTEEFDKWHNVNHNDTPLSPDNGAPVKPEDAEVAKTVQQVKNLI